MYCDVYINIYIQKGDPRLFVKSISFQQSVSFSSLQAFNQTLQQFPAFNLYTSGVFFPSVLRLPYNLRVAQSLVILGKNSERLISRYYKFVFKFELWNNQNSNNLAMCKC